MIIRPESANHFSAVRSLHTAAFPTPAEANLVDQLRASGDAVVSLVALEGYEVIGHVMLSRMRAPFRALGLAPVSVVAAKRMQGIASRLIEEAVVAARTAGWEAVFVLGDPAYYERFGFSAKEAAGLDSPYAGPYLMALALGEDGLPAQTGGVDYSPAFSGISD